MKKDGITEALKASRLSVLPSSEISSQASTKPSGKDHGNSRGDSHLNTDTHQQVTTEQTGPRVVAEERASTGSRGVPKSGRVWKRIKGQRFSKIRNDKPDTTTWQDKVEKKNDKAALKSFAQELKEEKLEREKVERERVSEKRKRKLENDKKNEIVVPIKNMAKIKRMRKKQLRSIEKR